MLINAFTAARPEEPGFTAPMVAMACLRSAISCGILAAIWPPMKPQDPAYNRKIVELSHQHFRGIVVVLLSAVEIRLRGEAHRQDAGRENFA